MPGKSGLPANFTDFENQDRAKLLSVIDQFRELGLGEDTSLPQLVVVGDQSSGKSSLLEGLTGLSFPVASDLCTRSATQIVLRRTTGEESIRVSIIPGPEAKEDESTRRRLEAFAHDIDNSKGFDLAEVLKEAAECMGLPSPDEENVEDLPKRFSDDVLKIELSGSKHPHLSVVDVPGLFHNPTKYQTKEDAVIIRQLIESYITDKRTIILAVMDGRNNLANQEVFQMARAADPQGARTVGIITKLDALQDGEKKGVFKIAANHVEKLHHGWFVVKNRSPQEVADGVTLEERYTREKTFFKTAPWDGLQASRKGVLMLKQYLGSLLYDHIRSEFPGLISEIRKLRNEVSRELNSMGQSRSGASEQRKYLTQLATECQNTLERLLMGIYPEDLSKAHSLRIRMHLHWQNECFSKAMTKKGHTRAFKTAKDEVDSDYNLEESQVDLFTDPEDSEDIYEWIRDFYHRGRGTELAGTVNMFLIPPAFREQSKAWVELSKDHIAHVYKVILDANNELFARCISDTVVRERIGARLQEVAEENYTKAKKVLDMLLEDERDGIIQTVNKYFAETLTKLRSERASENMDKARSGIEGIHIDIGQVFKMEDMNSMQAKAINNITNEQQAVYEIHDILKSYYKVALKRFVDNVVVQIVERIFVKEGPLKLFCPTYVSTMSDPELNAIAAEDFSVGMKRKELEGKIDRLEKAIDIARMLI